MTLSELGINYICANFGNTSLCCINTGLSWYYSIGDDDYPETGGTAQIVSRLASGLIDSLTMTDPDRGTFTQAELNEANGSVVTLQDAKTITDHDEASEDQWCFIPCADHVDQTTCEDVYECYWWNAACHDDAPLCPDLNNQADCLRYNCYWYNGSCHAGIICADILTQTECEAHNCYWYNGSCHSSSPACSELNNQADCERYECYWWNDACHDAPPSCEELLNEPDCSRYTCYWYRGVCHTVDQPELCYWIDAQGGPTALTIDNIFTIIDAYLYNTPPGGYSFIPTITEVFGVIDYYLGFNGDVKTGCLYY